VVSSLSVYDVYADVSFCRGGVCLSFQIGLETKGVLHMKEPPSKIQMGPQRPVAGGSTSKSSGSDQVVPVKLYISKAIHIQSYTYPKLYISKAIHIQSYTYPVLQSRTSAPIFCSIIMPLTPTSPTFTLQLFLKFPFSRLKFSFFWFISLDFFSI